MPLLRRGEEALIASKGTSNFNAVIGRLISSKMVVPRPPEMGADCSKSLIFTFPEITHFLKNVNENGAQNGGQRGGGENPENLIR